MPSPAVAADHSLRRELSRRIRDDLIRLGLVDPGPAVPIAQRMSEVQQAQPVA